MIKEEPLVLTPEQLEELEQKLEEKNDYYYVLRCHCILLKNKGHTYEEISRMLYMPSGRVNMWVDRYRKSGISGLTRSTDKTNKLERDYVKSDRKQVLLPELVLTPEQQEELEKEIIRTDVLPYYRMNCQAVLMKSKGYSFRKIARMLNMTPQGVNGWIRRYQKDGIIGLLKKTHTPDGDGRVKIHLSTDKDSILAALKGARTVKEAREKWEIMTGREIGDVCFKKYVRILKKRMLKQEIEEFENTIITKKKTKR
ncbi:MAG: helix-turn-helix domain-containing protein [Bacteroidales bacterium]|jgi:transposase|nr:helix-turn-helix domain-containing protein [Bacteroidales bacterium]